MRLGGSGSALILPQAESVVVDASTHAAGHPQGRLALGLAVEAVVRAPERHQDLGSSLGQIPFRHGGTTEGGDTGVEHQSSRVQVDQLAITGREHFQESTGGHQDRAEYVDGCVRKHITRSVCRVDLRDEAAGCCIRL